MRAQVGIIGAGPAGLFLSELLGRVGIETAIVESRSREYCEQRIRAGLLERDSVDLIRALGLGERMDREGMVHHGLFLRHRATTHYFGYEPGVSMTIYGQQEVVKDLIAALLARGGMVHFNVEDVQLHDLESEAPRITYSHHGAGHELVCDVIAGCDGFHGVCRESIEGHLREYDYVYEFGWLGILADAPPATDELIYAWHEHGFALHSMRSSQVSRLYLQVDADEDLENWPDDRIWDELRTRLGDVNQGEVTEKGITPMRSFVVEPMQHGRLFLAGDAAHIVPPTGAKGLNLAVNDVRLLAPGLIALLRDGDSRRVEGYSSAALRRVWRAQDFSNYMTQLLHDLGGGPFERKLQLSRLDYIGRSEAAARSLAENYVGLPAEPEF
jgi:p-hydroxybenzoate 3-monooxygenase